MTDPKLVPLTVTIEQGLRLSLGLANINAIAARREMLNAQLAALAKEELGHRRTLGETVKKCGLDGITFAGVLVPDDGSRPTIIGLDGQPVMAKVLGGAALSVVKETPPAS
jgi:hypothetical protein